MSFYTSPFDNTAELILLNTVLALLKIRDDYPGRQVSTIMRDGLVIAMPDHYLKRRLLGNVLGLYWPGINASPATTSPQVKFDEFRRGIQRDAELAFKAVNGDPSVDDMPGGFLKRISRISPVGFPIFVEHIARQIEESGVQVSSDIILYDTWGSGKTALLVASALMVLYPDLRIDVLMGQAYRDTRRLISVADEHGLRRMNALDGSWPFAEVLDGETGQPMFLFGRRGGEQASPIPSIAGVLASYNLAVRIGEGFDLQDIADMVLSTDMDSRRLTEFLFPE